MKFTVVIPDDFAELATITAIGTETIGETKVTNVLTNVFSLIKHDGDTIFLSVSGPPKWEKIGED